MVGTKIVWSIGSFRGTGTIVGYILIFLQRTLITTRTIIPQVVPWLMVIEKLLEIPMVLLVRPLTTDRTYIPRPVVRSLLVPKQLPVDLTHLLMQQLSLSIGSEISTSRYLHHYSQAWYFGNIKEFEQHFLKILHRDDMAMETSEIGDGRRPKGEYKCELWRWWRVASHLAAPCWVASGEDFLLLVPCSAYKMSFSLAKYAVVKYHKIEAQRIKKSSDSIAKRQ
ncbi:hypothetical protein HAX54_029650 [Datura stramonium]|uniref:Uncharacterized protein n=1 Tax=Datura stramonium TaxID=4076 RepID=A0ABS8SAF8_DATST|nr:hypothetical protein [Datura stramonium]